MSLRGELEHAATELRRGNTSAAAIHVDRALAQIDPGTTVPVEVDGIAASTDGAVRTRARKATKATKTTKRAPAKRS